MVLADACVNNYVMEKKNIKTRRKTVSNTQTKCCLYEQKAAAKFSPIAKEKHL